MATTKKTTKPKQEDLLEAIAETEEKIAELEAAQAVEEKYEYDPHEMVAYTGNVHGTRINGKRFPHSGVAPRGVCEVLAQGTGNKTMRLIREKVSTEWEVKQMAGGYIGAQQIKSGVM